MKPLQDIPRDEGRRRSSLEDLYACPKCPTSFSSGRALGGHLAAHRRLDNMMEKEGTRRNHSSTLVKRTAAPARVFPYPSSVDGRPSQNLRRSIKNGGYMHGDPQLPRYLSQPDAISIETPTLNVDGNTVAFQPGKFIGHEGDMNPKGKGIAYSYYSNSVTSHPSNMNMEVKERNTFAEATAPNPMGTSLLLQPEVATRNMIFHYDPQPIVNPFAAGYGAHSSFMDPFPQLNSFPNGNAQPSAFDSGGKLTCHALSSRDINEEKRRAIIHRTLVPHYAGEAFDTNLLFRRHYGEARGEPTHQLQTLELLGSMSHPVSAAPKSEAQNGGEPNHEMLDLSLHL
ncbi:hypothetical protein BHE74_00023160 [Ensete ventricosum]|nr:hypothetical protein BHE74_00023160 [Ensete ventricosum]